MLACDQESGSLSVSSVFWKIICRAGANALSASWIILAGTPSVVMMMSDIGGMFVLGSCGK